MKLQLVEFISLFLMVLVTGVFWGPWLALHRSLHLLNKEELINITKIMGKNLGPPMQILMPLCILFVGLSVLFYPHKNQSEFYLLISSFCCMIITLIVTLTTELPIVKKISQWTPETIPSDWDTIRDKWVRFHSLRVFPSIIAFILYIAAILYKSH